MVDRKFFYFKEFICKEYFFKGVTDVSIVGKGKNVVSVSRDGSCKLWNLGQSKCIANLYKGDSIINSCDIIDSSTITTQQNSIGICN